MKQKQYLVIEADTMSREGLNLLIQSTNSQSLIHSYAGINQSFEGVNLPHLIDHLILRVEGLAVDVLASLAQLRRWFRHCNILAITTDQRSIYLRSLIDHGVNHIVNPNCPREAIISAIQALGCNTNSQIKHTDKCDENIDVLTKRQKQVMQCILQGQANKQIAWQLGISEGTIKLHVSSILRALNATNRTEAALRYQHLCQQSLETFN